MIGVGNAFAGDDGVGPAVAEAMRGLPGLDAGVCAPSRLAERLLDGGPVVLVDAVRGAGPPGRVLVLGPEELVSLGGASSHGFGVAEALRLAGALGPLPPLRVVGVTVAEGLHAGPGLSPAVREAVAIAIKKVLELVAEIS